MSWLGAAICSLVACPCDCTGAEGAALARARRHLSWSTHVCERPEQRPRLARRKAAHAVKNESGSKAVIRTGWMRVGVGRLNSSTLVRGQGCGNRLQLRE